MEQGSKRFPQRDAYEFAGRNGLSTETAAVRAMRIEWDRSYDSTVRRGYMLALFESRGLFDQFVQAAWPFGGTREGEREKRRCLKISQEYDVFLSSRGALPSTTHAPESREEALEFALEAHLRDFLAKNLDRIEPGLRLYTDNGESGLEYPIDDGRIDVLAVDRSGKCVVIELKLSRGRNRALGQLLYYMGWIDQHLGNAPCRGLIIASDITDDLVTAVSRVPGVSLARYKMSFSVEHVTGR